MEHLNQMSHAGREEPSPDRRILFLQAAKSDEDNQSHYKMSNHSDAPVSWPMPAIRAYLITGATRSVEMNVTPCRIETERRAMMAVSVAAL